MIFKIGAPELAAPSDEDAQSEFPRVFSFALLSVVVV